MKSSDFCPSIIFTRRHPYDKNAKKSKIESTFNSTLSKLHKQEDYHDDVRADPRHVVDHGWHPDIINFYTPKL
jgi:hypothetical protein